MLFGRHRDQLIHIGAGRTRVDRLPVVGAVRRRSQRNDVIPRLGGDGEFVMALAALGVPHEE